MTVLYSNIPPLRAEDNKETILHAIEKNLCNADRIEIAVGYISYASLLELDHLVKIHHIGCIYLTIGMYYVEGMPENSYHLAMKLNNEWRAAGIGEIRIVQAFSYHGKVYLFFNKANKDCPFRAIVGSANLSVLKPDASSLRQYELAMEVDDPLECTDLCKHVTELKSSPTSQNIADIQNMKIISNMNTSLTGVEFVSAIPQSTIDLYNRHKTNTSFILPIKVPSFADRFLDDGAHFTKSNINVPYAAPRSAHKNRDWYETQMTVKKEITTQPGYPEKNVPFFIATDDGYWFKAHTTSDGNKQFSAVGDELIMGRWLKGRLAAAGLVTPINNTGDDKDRKGMITKEMLAAYHANSLQLTKTDQKCIDPDDNHSELCVWVLSFIWTQDEGE